MGEFLTVKQHEFCGECPWHGEGRDYIHTDIFPDVCPILYHSLYPYFLGLLYNADMQDIWVCCPAEKGVDVLVRKETNNGQVKGVPDDWWIIYAEIVKVGKCPHGHKLGEKIVFPTCWKKWYMCPAGVNNIFPFMDIEIPECINVNNMRCPDWKNTVHYSIEDE